MPSETLPTSYPVKRKHRRFELQLPVSVSFPFGSSSRSIQGISKNVSVGGLLLNLGESVPLHALVNLMIQVPSPGSRRTFRLMSEGQVVRVEKAEADGSFQIAVECKRPITEIETNLAVAS